MMAAGGIETAARTTALKETDVLLLDEITESGRSPGAVIAPSNLDLFITVVVPVRNEARFIARTLEHLVDQDFPGDRFEILVVDGGSEDETRAIAGSLATIHPNMKVLDNLKHLSSAARNIGLGRARGNLIVIVDGHCELEGRHYLRNLADAFERSGADCLGRPQPLDVTAASLLQKAIAAARSSWLGHHPDSYIYSGREQFVAAKSVAVAYRRSVFDQVGYFDESFDACEDVELNHRIDRAGLKCFFTPTIQVRYFPRSSLLGLFHQMGRYGRGRVRLLRKHPETFSPGGFIPAAWLAGLVLGPVVSLIWARLWWIYCGVLALYLTCVVLTSVSLAIGLREPRLIGWLPLVFLTVHSGSGWGVLSELFRCRKPDREATVRESGACSS